MVDKRYTTPTEGSLDWHIPLNENFNQLNRDVEFRDVDGNLSNYTPHTGRKFFATDTGRIYLGNGDNWEFVGALPSQPANVYVQSTEPTDAKEGDLWILPP